MDVHEVDIDEENINTELNELDLSDSASTDSINNQNITEIMYDYLFNIIIVGDSGVGKTDLIGKFCDEDFQTKFLTTMGINVESHCIDVDDKKIKLQIWDPSGSERYMHLTTKYFRNAAGIIFVYDITYPKSFANIKKWIDLVDKNTVDKSIPKILVGNKCDINRRLVTKEQGEKLAESSQMTFIEASAQSGLNVTKVFYSLCKIMKTLHEEEELQNQQQNQCKTNNSKEKPEGSI